MSFTTEHELSPELLQLEQQLESLAPTAMSQTLLERMEQSMNEVETEILPASDEFNNLEIHLTQMAPVSMPEEMLSVWRNP